MNETVVLTPERILEVTEDVLRRFGLAKATVVDVARALDVSHGSVYRHFPSKASLRQARGEALASTAPTRRLRRSRKGRGRRPPGWSAGLPHCLRSSTRKCVTTPRCSRPIWRWRRKRVRR